MKTAAVVNSGWTFRHPRRLCRKDLPLSRDQPPTVKIPAAVKMDNPGKAEK
jgi:hypothetical protein